MIRFGLLGCGRIARRHSDLLGGNRIKGATLATVCDLVRARADAIAAKFSVDAITTSMISSPVRISTQSQC
jgi:predicted dehydrogenase